MNAETKTAGGMAIAMAELARRCIGPNGTVFRVAAEDAPIVRSTFITRLAEAAMNILEQEEQDYGSH
jgi:hypothetical protein